MGRVVPEPNFGHSAKLYPPLRANNRNVARQKRVTGHCTAKGLCINRSLKSDIFLFAKNNNFIEISPLITYTYWLSTVRFTHYLAHVVWHVYKDSQALRDKINSSVFDRPLRWLIITIIDEILLNTCMISGVRSQAPQGYFEAFSMTMTGHWQLCTSFFASSFFASPPRFPSAPSPLTYTFVRYIMPLTSTWTGVYPNHGHYSNTSTSKQKYEHFFN